MNFSHMKLNPRNWEGISVHCSASDREDQSTLEDIHFLHTSPKYRRFIWGKYHVSGRGYDDVGYNYIIEPTGKLREGRPLHIAGAHTLGYNGTHIGICVIGDKDFQVKQFKTLHKLIDDLKKEFNINEEKVRPHNYFDSRKTCPNFNLEAHRRAHEEYQRRKTK